MRYFKLPDLGEGLQEAEIVEWHIKAGDTVDEDQMYRLLARARSWHCLVMPVIRFMWANRCSNTLMHRMMTVVRWLAR